MRALEIAIVLLNLVALLTLYLPLRPSLRWFKFLPAVIVVLTLVHLIVEQYRWQMVLSYALTAVLFVLSVPSLLKNTDPAPARGPLAFVAGGFGLLWWVVAAAL